jgi:hypothetical protein
MPIWRPVTHCECIITYTPLAGATGIIIGGTVAENPNVQINIQPCPRHAAAPDPYAALRAELSRAAQAHKRLEDYYLGTQPPSNTPEADDYAVRASALHNTYHMIAESDGRLTFDISKRRPSRTEKDEVTALLSGVERTGVV